MPDSSRSRDGVWESEMVNMLGNGGIAAKKTRKK
jgi:hypothetical protein